jgi:integrase
MLEDYFKKNRPNITLSSIKTYAATLKSLAKKLNMKIEKPDDIIDNADAIIKYYEDIPYTARKSHFSAMISFIDNGGEKAKNVLEKLRKILMKDQKQYETFLENQTKTEKQKDNWIEWPDVLERYKAFEKEVAPLWKLKKDEINKSSFNKLKMFVLLSCYVLIPPRRALDYAAFKIRNINETKDNYMKKRNFIFNNYKTAKTYGKNEVPIDYKLYSIMKKWIDINPSEWLITGNNNNMKAITVSQLTNMLNNFFDKKISVNMLRHSFLTHMYKDIPELKNMNKVADAMGHSVDQALEYVKK